MVPHTAMTPLNGQQKSISLGQQKECQDQLGLSQRTSQGAPVLDGFKGRPQELHHLGGVPRQKKKAPRLPRKRVRPASCQAPPEEEATHEVEASHGWPPTLLVK